MILFANFHVFIDSFSHFLAFFKIIPEKILIFWRFWNSQSNSILNLLRKVDYWSRISHILQKSSKQMLFWPQIKKLLLLVRFTNFLKLQQRKISLFQHFSSFLVKKDNLFNFRLKFFLPNIKKLFVRVNQCQFQ